MLTGEIKPIVDFISDHNAVWKIPGDGQQSVDLISTAHRSTRVVGVDEYQQTDIIVHLGPNISVVGLPLVRAVELVLDRLGPVHLRVGHVGRIVRARSKHFAAVLQNGGKNQLQCFGDTVANIHVVRRRWPAFSLFVSGNGLSQCRKTVRR